MLAEIHAMQGCQKNFHSMIKFMLCKVTYHKKFPYRDEIPIQKNLHNVIKIMLWKFVLQHQKHHVMENHAMEIHVRRGPTVIRNIVR